MAHKKTIILTGGGSAGHVIPNLILLPELLSDGWDVHYVGSRNGIESTLAIRSGITYHPIETGKLRRYFDVKNITDPFRVIAGIFQSLRLVAKLRPDVIFSKGGFVAVPVVLAGWFMGAPPVIHESDLTQGLANRICAPFSKKICLSFIKTMEGLSKNARKKAVYTGAPIRPELYDGIAEEGYRLCRFDDKKPVLLAMGGSQGSESINRIIRSALPELLVNWHVAHICGKDNIDDKLLNTDGYAQFGFVGDELAHLYKICRAAVSRAGSNTIFELLCLKIPSLLIPLPLSASRGDQVLNAAEFENTGYCLTLDESDAETPGRLAGAVAALDAEHSRLAANMDGNYIRDSKSLILDIIYSAVKI